MDSSPNPTDFESSAQSTMDAQLLVRFFVKPLKDVGRSEQQGRPVFRDAEYVDIRIPGSRDAICRPANAHDKVRFERHYEAFIKRIEAPIEGTPLAEWPLITRSLAEEMSFSNIKTVEALATVPDSAAANFRNLLMFKRKAQEWLALAESDAPLEQLNAKLAESERTIAAQDATIKDLVARMHAMEATARVTVPVQGLPVLGASALDSGMPTIIGPGLVAEPEPELVEQESTFSKRRRTRKVADDLIATPAATE